MLNVDLLIPNILRSNGIKNAATKHLFVVSLEHSIWRKLDTTFLFFFFYVAKAKLGESFYKGV